MFATPDLYTTTATYVDLPDREFFAVALDTALRHYRARGPVEDDRADRIKRNHTPVAYASKLSKQTADESRVPRTEINRSGRARRGFIMIDADFDPGEEDESQAMRDNMVHLADELSTPLLIYPTVSWPVKPRFRAVMFTQRALVASGYYQAVSWWYKQLGYDRPLDDGDRRMSANRNLPVFTNDDQVSAVVSTLRDEAYDTLLPGKLWKDMPRPAGPSKVSVPDRIDEAGLSDVDISYDRRELVKAMRAFARSGRADSYQGTWKLIESVALDVICKRISLATADKLVDTLALAAEDDRVRRAWEVGNRQMVRSMIERLPASKTSWSRAKPLFLWEEFFAAVRAR